MKIANYSHGENGAAQQPRSSRKAALLYGRFSDDAQNPSSADDQIYLCAEMAKRHGFTVAAQFKDEARSGSVLRGRYGYADMKEAVESGDFDAIFAENLDRLARNLAELAKLYDDCERLGVEIYTLAHGKITRMHVAMLGTAAQMFLENLATNVRRGHISSIRKGRNPGAFAYGYKRVPGKPGEMEIDPEAAEILRRIFREYASGTSPGAIAAGLMRDGIKSPSGMPHWNRWCFTGGRGRNETGTPKGMLGNAIYIGEFRWNQSRSYKTRTGTTGKRVNAREDWIVEQRPHLRIIDQELWDAAQALRRKRATLMFGPNGKVKRRAGVARNTEHPLSGLLKCGMCGGHMRIAQSSRDGAPRAACAAAHQHGTCSHTRSFDMDQLLASVLARFESKLRDPRAVIAALKALATEQGKKWKQESGEAKQIERQLQDLRIQSDNLVAGIRAGKGRARDVLAAELDKIEEERAAIQQRLELVRAHQPAKILEFPGPAAEKAYHANIDMLLDGFASSANPEAQKRSRAALRNVIDFVAVHPSRKRMPYDPEAFLRPAALLGLDLAGKKPRPAREVLAAQGVAYFDRGMPKKSGTTISEYSAGLISLGRRADAA